jgi:hypothetical protein
METQSNGIRGWAVVPSCSVGLTGEQSAQLSIIDREISDLREPDRCTGGPQGDRWRGPALVQGTDDDLGNADRQEHGMWTADRGGTVTRAPWLQICALRLKALRHLAI